MTEPEAIMREDLLYDQEQQRQYERQVHREKVAWEIDRKGFFRLPRDERIKIGNTGMHKRTVIPRLNAPNVKLPPRPAPSSIALKDGEHEKTRAEWEYEYESAVDEWKARCDQLQAVADKQYLEDYITKRLLGHILCGRSLQRLCGTWD